MTGSAARKQRRAEGRVLRAAGVAVVARRIIRPEHEGDVDVLVFEIGRAIHDLRREGGDLTSRLAITVGGDHPQYPGVIVVEAKASEAVKRGTLRVDEKPEGHRDDCPGCPIDHSL